jgi:hypothetical protein
VRSKLTGGETIGDAVHEKRFIPIQAIRPEGSFLVCDNIVRICVAHSETVGIDMVGNAIETPGNFYSAGW